MEKIGLNYKDTKVILNTKRVAVEEFRKYYYRKNREACPKPPTKKMFYDKLEEINKSLNLIKKTNCKIWEACPKPPTKKMFYDKLEEINKSLNLIKKTNCEILVGTSTQIQLACEMGQKMNGIGIF